MKQFLNVPSGMEFRAFVNMDMVVRIKNLGILFIYFIFYLFNFGNKNIQLKVYRKNSFSIKRKTKNGPLKIYIAADMLS